MVDEFWIGDPVWAKMKGYPPWPAKIVNPPPNAKPQKNKHFVFFFGSNNNAWIPTENISHHNEEQLQNSASKKKNATLQNAIDVLMNYSKSYKRKKPSSPKVETERKDKKPSSPKVETERKDKKRSSPKVETGKSIYKKPYTKRFISNSSLLPRSSPIFDNKCYIKSKRRSLKALKVLSANFTRFGKPKSAIPSALRRSNVPQYSKFFNEDSSVPRLPPNSKPVQPSTLRFGFIGLGTMGKSIVKTLLQTGHDVTVWNRTLQQCEMLLIFGARRARSPADLIIDCDVTFCCVSDIDATKAVIFGEQGVLMGLVEASKMGKGRRGFVNMTNADPLSSQKMQEAITKNCGYYLEAPLWGSSVDAEKGQLLVLAAGDRILFSDSETCFQSISKHAYYLSCDIGEGNKVILILNTLFGSMCVAMAEAMVTCERLKLQKEDLLHSIVNSAKHCSAVVDKAKMMTNQSFQLQTALKHMQKNLDMTITMANTYCQPMPVTVAANETYKIARLRKISEEDISAVYKIVKF